MRFCATNAVGMTDILAEGFNPRKKIASATIPSPIGTADIMPLGFVNRG
ncbi:hypothetical protein [Mongoliitalea daihaiensis]|nr:hypothetical protein [Mongoliitalea daihaiensis]UJP64230.1 hypothetical protein IPZ59_15655 [Mongoliitalea daihaiensis]